MKRSLNTQTTPEDQYSSKRTRKSTSPPPSLPTQVTTPYLSFIQTGSNWHGCRSLKNLIVFSHSKPGQSSQPFSGDSYSASIQQSDEDHSVDPSTFTWVDFLASFNPCTNLNNFAFPGATVGNDLDSQLAHFFMCFSEREREISPYLDSTGTTYVLFLGINDCGRTFAEELEPLVETLFDAIHRLYIKARARNFVVVDVPPIDRSPGASSFRAKLKDRVETWNELLLTQAPDVVNSTKEASLFLFSSNKLLSEILDDPLLYNLAQDDARLEDADIWQDDLHITRSVHKIFANHMASLWNSAV